LYKRWYTGTLTSPIEDATMTNTVQTEPRTWRIAAFDKPKGRYQALQHGRADTRKTIALGYVGDEAAARALGNLNREERETFGTERYDRILRLHATKPAEAIAILIGDAVKENVFGPETVNYGATSLRDYANTVFGPARAKSKPRSWKAEEDHWSRINRGIGDTRLEGVDEFVVADWLDGLVCESGPRKGQPLGYNTKRLYRNSVGYALKYAYRHKHIHALPNLAIFDLDSSWCGRSFPRAGVCPWHAGDARSTS
jgi:hypothetical protein